MPRCSALPLGARNFFFVVQGMIIIRLLGVCWDGRLFLNGRLVQCKTEVPKLRLIRCATKYSKISNSSSWERDIKYYLHRWNRKVVMLRFEIFKFLVLVEADDLKRG